MSRKKCDERHPICRRCFRHATTCSWPNIHQLKDGRNKKAAHVPVRVDERNKSPKVTQLGSHAEIVQANAHFDFDFSSANGSLGNDPELLLQPLCILEPRILFKSDEQQSIFTHFASTLLPSLVHRDARPEYHDQFYMLRMGLVSPILMNTMVACAAMHLSMSSEYYRPVALRNYVAALRSMREEIHSGKLAGTEDHLLATTSFLCIFEVCHTHP